MAKRICVLVAAVATAAGIFTSSASAVTCDSSISTRTALGSALSSTANSGKTVCITADITGSQITTSADMTSQARFIGQPVDNSITVPGITFDGASRITVEGVDMLDTAYVGSAPVLDIHILNNWFHDTVSDALDISNPSSGAHDGIWFIGNNVEHITFNGSFGSGYGIRTLGGPNNNTKFNYNTFDMNPANAQLNNTGSADGMEVGDLHNFEIIGNVVKNDHWYGPGGSSDPHADALMVWNGSDGGLIKDNRLTDSENTLFADSTNITLENNLIVRMRNLCHNGGSANSPNGLRNYTWTRNTMYQCGDFFGGWGSSPPGTSNCCGLNTDGPDPGGIAPSGNVLDRNLLVTLDYDNTGCSQFTTVNHNLTHAAWPCSGTNTGSFSPTFADTVDWLPTNLPTGYSDVGYRDAPAGHLENPGGGGGTDTTPPDTSITSSPSNPSSSANPSFSFTGTDNVGVDHYECKLDSGSYATCTSPKSYTANADGSHTFSVRAVDVAANVDAYPATYTWTINTSGTAPTADFTYSASRFVGVPVQFTFTGSCASSSCTYNWNHAGTTFATTQNAGFMYSESTSTKDVTLSVTDVFSRTSTVTKSFAVNPADTTDPTRASPLGRPTRRTRLHRRFRSSGRTTTA